MRSVVDSIYKVCNGYTWKTSLQVVFALVAFLPQTESAVENQEVANLRVQVVFTDLPEPYLPGIGRAYSLDDLGVEFRPSSHSRDDEEFRDSFHTPPDFGVLSGHDHNRGQLCLTLDQTDLKARRVEENLTSIGLTVVSQDDKQTTSDNRRAELSTSVCAHGSLSNDSYIIAIIQQERKTEAESYVQLRANTFDRRWPHKHLKPDKMAEASFVYTDDDPLVEHFLFSPDCEYILNEQQDNPQNFGASSRTGAAQEDFDEHNGAYASVESEKAVHERRFRYAGHVEQNGHWKLEIENTNQETTHSIQNCATKKYDMQRRHCPHGGRGNNHIGKNHSETNGEGHAAGLFMHKCQGPSSSTAAPIDKKLVNDPLESDEVRTVLSKGYKRTDVASVVEAILKAGGIITVDKLMRALGRIRARRIVRK